MSDDQLTSPEEGESSEIGPPSAQLRSILQSLEVTSLEKGIKPLDLNNLTEAQLDKAFELLKANEDHSITYHLEKIKADKEVNLALINASTVEQRTTLYFGIAAFIVFSIFSLAIIFYKPEFFSEWLAFIAGIGGGFGIKSFRDNRMDRDNDLSKSKEEE